MSTYMDASFGMGRRHRMPRRRRGRGILDTLKRVARAAHPFIKKSGIVSHLAGKLHPSIGLIAKNYGYGRRRRVRRRGLGRRRVRRRRGGSDSLFTKYLLGHGRKRRSGKGFWSDFGNGFVDGLKGVHDVVKNTGLISKGLALTGNPALGAAAGLFGYGRRVHRRRRIGGMSAVKLAVMRSVLGQGRRRRRRRY